MQAPFGETESQNGWGGRDLKDHFIPSPAVGAKSLGKPHCTRTQGPRKTQPEQCTCASSAALGLLCYAVQPGHAEPVFCFKCTHLSPSVVIYNVEWIGRIWDMICPDRKLSVLAFFLKACILWCEALGYWWVGMPPAEVASPY